MLSNHNGPKRREFIPWMDPIEDIGRPLETMVLKDTLKDSIIKRIQSFIDKKQRYLDRGHRHQYGMLWDGLPGCGKSSLIDAIAKRFGFTIYIFPLGDVTLNDSALMTLYLNMGPMAIAVFEDIDRVQLGEKGITEAVLLMLLDGPGRKGKTLLKIMTCNNKEKVSPAVRRRGRVDADYYFP
jgi:chaperone BCS1